MSSEEEHGAMTLTFSDCAKTRAENQFRFDPTQPKAPLALGLLGFLPSSHASAQRALRHSKPDPPIHPRASGAPSPKAAKELPLSKGASRGRQSPANSQPTSLGVQESLIGWLHNFHTHSIEPNFDRLCDLFSNNGPKFKRDPVI